MCTVYTADEECNSVIIRLDSSDVMSKSSKDLVRTACETDDSSLMEQALLGVSEKEKHDYLKLAIENNATKILAHLIKDGADVKGLCGADVQCRGPKSKETLEVLLAHGWDINERDTSQSQDGGQPYMWYWDVLRDIDMVTWCLDHGAGVYLKYDKPPSEQDFQQILEKAAVASDVATFDALRANGAPLGWRPLHLAVQTSLYEKFYPPSRGNIANRGGGLKEEGQSSQGVDRGEFPSEK